MNFVTTDFADAERRVLGAIARLEGTPRLNDFFRACEALGCTVRYPRRTGDALVSHPRLPKQFRINNRRKDAPQFALLHIRRLAQEILK